MNADEKAGWAVTHCWLIWSNEHKAWWKAGKRGYTATLSQAARMTFEEACQILNESNKYRWFLVNEPYETMVPISSLPDNHSCLARAGWKDKAT